MGFRCSWYHVPNDVLDKHYYDDKINYDVDDEYALDEYIRQNDTDLTYDAFTDSVLKVYKDTEYCSPLYENNNDIEGDDFLYRKMNKEQFKNFIKYIMKDYADYWKSHIVDNVERNLQKEFEELAKSGDYVNRNYHDYDQLPVSHKIISNQYDYNLMARFYCGDISSFDELMDAPWKVSLGWSTPFMICNFIFIYKTLDWSKESVVVIGS